MMLTEQTTVSGAALPLQALKDHLRLGSGFADDGMQDALVESYLRAAMAVIAIVVATVAVSALSVQQQMQLKVRQQKALTITATAITVTAIVIKTVQSQNVKKVIAIKPMLQQ